MVKPVDKWVGKYSDRASVAEGDYEYGVRNPKRPPVSAAIANRDALQKKMAMKETWDKWEAGLKFVGDAGVMNAAATKGKERYVSGVRAGIDKVRDFASKFASHLEAGQRKVWAMPKVTTEDSVNRAAAMIRHNATFRYKK